MKKLLVLAASLVAVVALAPSATSRPMTSPPCTPVAMAPYVGLTNYAGNRGYTQNCADWYWSGYHWMVAIIDADTYEVVPPYYEGTWNRSMGGTDISLDYETFAMCLRPDGTARNVKSMTIVWVNPNVPYWHLSPGTSQCKRVGGTSAP